MSEMSSGALQDAYGYNSINIIIRSIMIVPVPGVDDEMADAGDANGSTQCVFDLCVCVAVGCGEWRDVDGISDRLVT